MKKRTAASDLRACGVVKRSSGRGKVSGTLLAGGEESRVENGTKGL